MKTNVLAMIPARMGSQRLPRKNLAELDGVPLIVRAIRKCRDVGCFDEIWVNSEHPDFGPVAEKEGVNFHQRPQELGNNQATSEQYIAEFLKKHECDWLVQVHSIAPLLTTKEVRDFVGSLESSSADCVLSYEPVQIECSYQGQPVNFTYTEKTNSQDLEPIQRISWSITAWRRKPYLKAVEAGTCATYAGKVDYYPVGHLAGHVIKTQRDLDVAEALLPLVESSNG
jgi:CMP-N-acetylneuraminic acid synthetase